MTLNTCASMKLEVHFQRKQVRPGRSRAGEGLRGTGEWVHTGGAAILHSVITLVCARTAPGHGAAPGAAGLCVSLSPRADTAPEVFGCISRCPCLPCARTPLRGSGRGSQRAGVAAPVLGQPWWSAQGCVPVTCTVTLGVSAEPGAETPRQRISRRKPDPGGMGETSPRVTTTINIGILITKPFLFPLMNNTFIMHTSFVFSIWKSLRGCIPSCSDCPYFDLGRDAALHPALLCAAVHGHGFAGRLHRDVPTACEPCEPSRGSLEAAPSLPRCCMALGHGQNDACWLLEPSVAKEDRSGLKGPCWGCALCWGACPRRESRAGGHADPLWL